jgi:hypothetical protein
MLVRETISFHRGIDPKLVLGIGQKNFRSYEDFGKFLISIIPSILGTDEIPKDILQEKHHVIKQSYYNIINQFIEEKKFTVKNKFIKDHCSWPWLVDDILSKQGYSTDKIYESLLEFERGKDPKEMLGIGEDFAPEVFYKCDVFINYLLKILPHIFGGAIPNDIISSGWGIINQEYFIKISKYLREHNKKFFNKKYDAPSDIWEDGDGHEFLSWPGALRPKLIKMGYKTR